MTPEITSGADIFRLKIEIHFTADLPGSPMEINDQNWLFPSPQALSLSLRLLPCLPQLTC